MCERSQEIWKQIRDDKKLKIAELTGLRYGEARGKHPDVSIETLSLSLEKQWEDFVWAYAKRRHIDKENLLKTLADLRIVAGIFFLKLEGKQFFEGES